MSIIYCTTCVPTDLARRPSAARCKGRIKCCLFSLWTAAKYLGMGLMEIIYIQRVCVFYLFIAFMVNPCKCGLLRSQKEKNIETTSFSISLVGRTNAINGKNSTLKDGGTHIFLNRQETSAVPALHSSTSRIGSFPPLLLYACGTHLSVFQLEMEEEQELVTDLNHAVFLDYLWSSQGSFIYWSDNTEKRIYRAFLKETGIQNETIVVSDGIGEVQGLAVDWVGKHLYWLDKEHKHLEVSLLDGSMRASLAQDLRKPRGLALDPHEGLLFWADWNSEKPVIERMDMSGYNRRIVVAVEKSISSGWPNGVTLDYATRHVYWVDGRSGSVHKSNYDGTQHEEVIRSEEYVHVFSVAVFQDSLFWTDFKQRALLTLNNTSSKTKLVTLTYPSLYDLKVIHPSRQAAGVNPCQKANGNCSHICLLGREQTAVCACPYGLVLAQDNKTCQGHSQLLIYVVKNKNMLLIENIENEMRNENLPVHLDESVRSGVLVGGFFYWVSNTSVQKLDAATGITIPILNLSQLKPKYVAVDYYTENVYIMSEGHDEQSRISSCSKNGEFFTTILWEDMYEPLSLVVDSLNRLLYWTHMQHLSGLNFCIIESSHLDGKERHQLLSYNVSANVHCPSSLVALSTSHLCWLSNSQVLCIDSVIPITSTKLVTITDASLEVIALGGDSSTLFYVLKNGSLYSVDKSASILSSKFVAQLDASIFLGVTRFHNVSGSSPCAEKLDNCTALCFPVSSSLQTCPPIAGVDRFILVVTATGPEALPLKNQSIPPDIFPFPHFTTCAPSSIECHVATNMVYWSNCSTGDLMASRRDGKKLYRIGTTEGNITALAIDWIAENMYWIKSVDATIRVSHLDGKHQFVVIWNNLQQPSAIAVDPKNGFLFWSECSSKVYIERSTLSGKNRQVLVKDRMLSVSDLALDSSEMFVYWTDPVAGVLERIHMDGNKRELLVSSSTPLSVAVGPEHFYWTDSNNTKGSAFLCNKNSLSEVAVLKGGLGHDIGKLRLFDITVQQGTNLCASNNGRCEQLCFYEGSNQYSCACTLSKLQDDGRSCGAHTSFLLVAHGNQIESFSLNEPFNVNPPMSSITPSGNIQHILDMAVDNEHQKIYFSDLYHEPYIFSINLDGSGIRPLINDDNLHRQVEGMYYDDIHKDLYWTDNIQHSICCLKITTNKNVQKSSQVEVIVQLDPLDKPRGIAVDSCGLRIYWTNWKTNAQIERSYLNGSSREAIVTKGLNNPNGLTLDHKISKIFWVDYISNDGYLICMANLDGTSIVVITEGAGYHPFDVSVSGSLLFWTDWKTKSLLITDWKSSKGPTVVRSGLTKFMGVAVSTGSPTICMSTTETMTDSQLIQSEKCDQYCLNGGSCSLSSFDNESPLCVCSDNFTGKRCDIPIFEEFSIKYDYSVIVGVAASLLVVVFLLLIAIFLTYRRYHHCREWFTSPSVFRYAVPKNYPIHHGSSQELSSESSSLTSSEPLEFPCPSHLAHYVNKRSADQSLDLMGLVSLPFESGFYKEDSRIFSIVPQKKKKEPLLLGHDGATDTFVS